MTHDRIVCILQITLVLAEFTACGGGGGGNPSSPVGVAETPVTVTSTAFSERGTVPIDNTCDGKDTSPEISWSAPPSGTKSLVLVIDDPDAPGGTFTHFLAYGIPADVHELKAAVDLSALGARAGQNDFGGVRYNGPCPPKGEEHSYRFQVFALDVPPTLPEAAVRKDVDAAMSGHVLGRGLLNGVFGH
ncbi:MAG: YbhB/YbcL family Raf kinase inhibitor-like protein [Polyangiaceae bacterium]